ncbi:transposase [Bifidobacterium adolescentis]|jgi:transposase-like protein|uniref:transposase n=1 Tax=Bifidobacterium adolescentis TaxID=1680 RepID=UPI001F15016B|nr:transposase [Bifidobacterium adolescentis]
MAKYSKEQHDRAVDLYVRYERCAADVIHELGYPSRGMLPVWYRERLEEERTGRQSTRGKRYRRYTDEQKRAAVDHYLGHGRRLKRTMRALGYPKSHELLTAWIDELDADVERQRREKKELDIEIAIRKGALELSGKEPGADPEKPGQPREDAPRQDR